MPLKSEKEFSLKQVEVHNRADDFWTVVDNVVYDLSGYLEQHPGGAILMNAAGADSTVNFHLYHVWEPEVAKKVLSKFRIGILKEENYVSPDMGDFWRDCSQRIVKHLKERGVARRPLQAKIFFFVDLLLHVSMALSAFYLRPTTPLWILAIYSSVLFVANSLRMLGQSHANGHEQIFEPKSGFSYWGDVMGVSFSMPPLYVFSNPTFQNRRLLNQPRHLSQYEHVGARGMGEHVAIHHVKGVHSEHDQCHTTASYTGLYRLSETRPWKPMHRYQTEFWYGVFSGLLENILSVTRVANFRAKLSYIYREVIGQGDYVRGTAMVCGMLTSPLLIWCLLALPCSGWTGLKLFVVLAVVRLLTSSNASTVFWAQHVWDYDAPEEDVVNKDWGRHNAASCYSWWPSSFDIIRHPFLWGFNGSCPATLTYHLEHTLFPSVNYMHLPYIAPIVRAACKDYNIEYHGLYSTEDLAKARYENILTCQFEKKSIKTI